MIRYFTGFVSGITLIRSFEYYFLSWILSTSYSGCQNNVPIGAILSVWVCARCEPHKFDVDTLNAFCYLAGYKSGL